MNKMMKQNHANKSHGLSLIELMVALAVSSILLLGVATIYTASKRSYNVNTGIATIQENARFSLHFLTTEIRQAGYTGCSSLSATSNSRIKAISTNIPPGFAPPVVPPLPAVVDIEFGLNNYITGHVISDAGGVTPAFDAGLQPPNLVAGTDAVTIRKVSACSAKVTAINPPNMSVVGNCNFNQGEAVIITDCRNSNMFTIVNEPEGDRQQTLNFSLARNRRGAGGQLPTGFNLDNNPKVLKVETITYYMGSDNNGDTHLYERRLIVDLAGNYTPSSRVLVPNVLEMVINYGVNTTADNINGQLETNSVDVLVPANQVQAQLVEPGLLNDPGDSPWSQVNRVDLRLLVASEDNTANAPQPYTFNNVNYDGGANPLPNDRRYRREFITAINLRNRTP